MYIPFNIKTDYYLNHSIIKIPDLISFALKNNIKALTITDDNMFGAMEFYKSCTINNIKPIIGLNIKKNDLDIILYALNYEGYKSLLKISTIYRKEKDVTLKKDDNILCIVPYESRSLYNELSSLYKEIYASYKDKEQKEKIKLKNKIYMDEVLYLDDSEVFKYFNHGVESNNKLKLNVEDNSFLYDKFNLKIEKNDDLLPINIDADKKLKNECVSGLKKIFGEKVGSKYIERLKYELSVINEMGFSNYFLVVSDYVKFAKKSGILVGPGRGSAVGSLVSYVLGITSVDPLKYGLLFERFLNKDRITMPDIDIDFDANRRIEVINYCISKYGFKNVAGVVTFSTLSLKQAIKDLASNFDLDLSDTNFLINNLDKIEMIEKQPNLFNLYKIAKKLEGIKTNMSVNASGIVISRDEIDNYAPLEYHNDMYLVGFTKDYLEDVGLLKMDFLALKNLTTISNIIEDKIDIESIPLNDQKTFDIFNNLNTLGIFQFETESMKDALKKFKITSFDDIYNLSALARPGAKDNIDSYVKRKLGKEKINYFHPDLESVLKNTYGIIIYQEQIILIANILAGYTLGEADILRRAMSKKDESILINEKEKFIERSINRGYDKKLVSEIYDYILKFAEYGFNKSHSVAYAKISYIMAYLKANYKEKFAKVLLEEVSGSNIIKEYLEDIKKNDVHIITPDINISTNDYVIDSGIVLPLTIIKDVNISISNNIISNRPYNDIYDFLLKVDTKLVNKDIVLNLIKAGAFDKFENRKTLIENIDIIFNYIELTKEIGETNKPILKEYEEYSNKEIVKLEYSVFGFYINNNPITIYRKELKLNKSLNSISTYINHYIEIVLCIDKIKITNLKDNKKMCFLKLSDNISSIEGVVFNDDLNNIDTNLEVNDIVIVKGKVNLRNGSEQIIINDIKKTA